MWPKIVPIAIYEKVFILEAVLPKLKGCIFWILELQKSWYPFKWGVWLFYAKSTQIWPNICTIIIFALAQIFHGQKWLFVIENAHM